MCVRVCDRVSNSVCLCVILDWQSWVEWPRMFTSTTAWLDRLVSMWHRILRELIESSATRQRKGESCQTMVSAAAATTDAAVAVDAMAAGAAAACTPVGNGATEL